MNPMTDAEHTNASAPQAGRERNPAVAAAATAVWTLVWLGCWGILAGGLALTATRLFDTTRSIRVLVVHGVTPFLYFGVWPVAALALWRRKWVLGAVAVALVGVHLAVTLPAVWPRSAPSWAAAAPKVTMLVANVKADNGSQSEAARQLMALDADVVVVIEVTDRWVTVLDGIGFDAAYPYRVLQSDSSSARGSAIFSKFPITPGPVIDLGRGRRAPSGEVTLPDGSQLAVFAMHLVSPYAKVREERWRENFETVLRTIPTLKGRYVLAGDFNATRWHRFFGRLLGAGLTDAHERAGKGLTLSWPTDEPKGVIPPVMRLDHALMSDGVTALSVRDFRIVGSDHKGFVTELAVRPGG